MATQCQAVRLNSAGFFQAQPVFSLAQFSKSAELRRATALERIKYHLARGRLKALERGLYAFVPAGVVPETFQPDRYLAAHAARPDSVFSYHAALELLGSAHSDWNVCSVFTRRRRPNLKLNRVEIRFLRHPASLERKGLERLGIRKVERLGTLLRVTGPERTLVDGFRHPGLVGGLSELIESAGAFGVLDLDLLRKILEAYNQKALWAAVGWFLERFQQSFFVPEQYLSLLEKHQPRSPHYLPRGERSGMLLRRWNLILPANVVNGGEPDEPE